jgi:MotA/TolQ/ExbB proton channel family
VAAVVASGVTAFGSAPHFFTHGEAVGSAQHAFARCRRTTSAQLKRGLGTVTTVASSAPFIGLLGTVFGILGAFRGVGMERAAYRAMVASYLAESLITAAMGMAVAIAAVWGRDSVIERTEKFEIEMSNAALEATTYLSARGEWRTQTRTLPRELEFANHGFWENPSRRDGEVPYDHQQMLLLPMSLAKGFTLFLLTVAIVQSCLYSY